MSKLSTCRIRNRDFVKRFSQAANTTDFNEPVVSAKQQSFDLNIKSLHYSRVPTL